LKSKKAKKGKKKQTPHCKPQYKKNAPFGKDAGGKKAKNAHQKAKHIYKYIHNIDYYLEYIRF